MKAPEKIYVANNVFPTHVDFDGSPINTKRIDDSDIEYVRADILIEKAVKFFIPYIRDNSGGYDRAAVIENFKNYMKEE